MRSIDHKGLKKYCALLAVLCLSLICSLPALAASKELIVYTALENEQIGKYLESFKSQNKDIDVKIVRDSTGIITAKLLAEGSNTPADVVWGTAASSLLVLEDRGMIQPYAPKGLDRVEKMLKDKANPPAWVGIDAWECAIVVNTAEAKAQNLPQVKSYQDLLKPEFKGQIVMSNPNSSGTGFLAVAGLIHLMGEKKAFEYLDKLHQNIAMYTHSGSAPAKKAAAGEFAVGISYGYAGINQKKKGAPVEIIFPIEGSGWDVEANALIKKKDIKPEAKKFLDWAISDEAINALKGDYAITAVKMDNKIPDGYSKDPLSQLIKKNDLRWSAKNRARILKEWASRYDGKSEPKK
ncbi:MAG: putative 2-aminoethylphosphonate ABC transporter substrate-binding protein [Synergistaceae bacterium]|nr:putative 2-aminoethylphosphonate ABC transporter substrate-binding protein [Synergistaceae bacterium]